MTYIVQSCPRCGKRLLKVAAGSVEIGSPLLKCKQCDATYTTDYRKEWVDYPHKTMVFTLPFLLPAVGFFVSIFMGKGNTALAVMTAGFLFVIGLGFFIKDFIKILASKKRMKDPDYLMELLSKGVIGENQYKTYIENANR